MDIDQGARPILMLLQKTSSDLSCHATVSLRDDAPFTPMAAQLPRRPASRVASISLGLLLFPLWLMGCGEGGAASSASSTTPSAPTANLLFKSNFWTGVALGAPYGFHTSGTTGGAWQDLTGTDSETGYTWPIKAIGSNYSKV